MQRKYFQGKDDEDQEIYCCFNPFCPLIFQRVFKGSHKHFSEKSCKKWLIGSNIGDIEQDQQFINGDQFDNENGTKFIFFDEPISMLRSATILQNLAQKKVVQKIKKIRMQINGIIDVIQANSILKVRNLFEEARRVYKNIQSIAKSTSNDPFNIPFRINEFLNNEIYQLEEIKDTTFLNHKMIDLQVVNIKKDIQKIMENIICQTPKSNTTRNLKQVRKLMDYLSAKGDAGKQTQALTKLTKSNPQQIAVSKNQQTKVACSFCSWVQFHTSFNTRQSRKIALQALIRHIIIQHQQEAMFHFISRITKISSRQLTLSQTFYYMKSHDYQVLQIVDNSAVKYKQTFNREERSFVVEVVSRQKKNQQISKYIVANNQEVDTIVVVLAYVVGYVYKKKIHLVNSTKKANYIVQFLKNQGISVIHTNPLISGPSKSIKSEQDQTNVLHEEMSQSSQFTFRQ